MRSGFTARCAERRQGPHQTSSFTRRHFLDDLGYLAAAIHGDLADDLTPPRSQGGHQLPTRTRVRSAINEPAPTRRSTILPVVDGWTSSRPESVEKLIGPSLDKITNVRN